MLDFPVYDPADVEAQLRRLKGDDSFDDALLGDSVLGDSAILERARYYRKMSENPRGAGRLAPIGTPEMIRAVEALSAAAPTFSQVSGVVLRAIALSMQTGTPLSIPPLLFLGPPGVGKTFFSRSLAQALGVPYAEYSMALSDDPGELVGHSLSWRGARPGLVARTLIEGWSVAPVLLVDEVEKTQWSNYGNPLDPFHALLEPESARTFRDAYLDIPLRAERILWFFTANEIDTLRSSLIDRMTVVAVAAPNEAQRAAIIRSLYSRFIAPFQGRLDPNFADEVIEAIADATPRTARRFIETGFGFAAQDGRRGLTPADIAKARRHVGQEPKHARFGFHPAK
jgi:ATP-dependent Lon protease